MGKQVQNLFGKSFLITGATGFIGANLTRHLVGGDAKVHILTRQESNKWRIQDIIHKVSEHQVDLLDYERLRKIVFTIKPNIIFHCAAYGGYPFQQEVNKIMETNILGTLNLLNALSAVGHECFVNTGSSSEYGLKSKPMSEEDLLEPINAYGVSKAAVTLFCQSLARSQKRPIVTLRLFSPYGPYEEPTRLIPSVITACLLEKNPEVTSGEAFRDFVFIEDVIDLFMKVVVSPQLGQVVNVGSGKQHSVREVVEKIIRLSGVKVQPRWGTVPPRPFEPRLWVADASKAKRLFNWVPQFSLDEGLSQTISWYKDRFKDFSIS